MNLKLRILTGLLSLFCFGVSVAEREENYLNWVDQYEDEYAEDMANGLRVKNDLRNENFSDCDNHDNVLKLKLLCAHKARIKCLKARCIDAYQIDVDNLNAENFCTGSLKTQSVCTESLGVNGSACINILTSNDIQTGSLCVTGPVNFNELCNAFKALADFNGNTPYVLGDNIDFDNIVEDPNGDVALAPFSYTAPRSGWYAVTLQVDQIDLDTADPVLGVPTAHLQLYVNGLLVRDATTPYLTFSNQQKSNIGSLLRLQAGDIVQARYSVDQLTNAGLSAIVGTVTIEGGPDKTLFGIHYLSSLCPQGPPIPCDPRPCMPCDTSCVTQPCAPCFPCNP